LTRRRKARTNQTGKGTKVVTVDETVSDERVRMGLNLLVLLQVNCRNILHKSSDFFNLIGIYNLDVIIGTESWLREDISNAEVFRDN
jgi:hypothetical protein